MQRHRNTALVEVLSAALLVILVFAAVGCGGGDEEAVTETTAPVVVAETVPAVPPPPKAFANLVGTSLTPSEETPEEVRTGLEQHQPMVIAFYVTGGTDDAVVLDSLDALALRFSDVDFYTFDYKKPAAYGDLSALLEVDYPPQVAFIDARGTVRAVTSGYADEGTLNQNVVNIR